MTSPILDEHRSYLRDTRRSALLQDAIAQVVTPGCRVVDLGCGSGILGLLALRAGAGHVVAIDSTPILEVARQTMAREGFTERCTFVPDSSYAVTLDAPADVIVCDHVGYFGFDYDLLGVIQDARQRFLKPGGTLLPRRLDLFCAPVTSPSCWEKVRAWTSEGMPAAYGWLDSYAVNTKHAVVLTADEVAARPVHIARFNLHDDHPPVHTWKAELVADRDCQLHGIAGWFSCLLAAGVEMTNSPLASDHIDRDQAFFPIADPVEVGKGSTIAVSITARPAEGIIQWDVSVPAQQKRFRHSTWQGMILTPGELKRSRPHGIPVLSPRGRARALVLSACDGQRTAKDIETLVAEQCGDLFPTRAELAKFVSQVLGGDTI